MSTNSKPLAIDLADWVSLSEAARLRGVTRQAISKLVKQGRLDSVNVAGRPLVDRKQVIQFKPNRAGRPKVKSK